VAVLDANMAPNMAPFSPPSVNAAFLGTINGTFNAALFLWWLFSIQNRYQKCRNHLFTKIERQEIMVA
jgi:hypothetical protein